MHFNQMNTWIILLKRGLDFAHLIGTMFDHLKV